MQNEPIKEDPIIDYDEILRSQQLAESKAKPSIPLNAACFLIPLVMALLAHRLKIFGVLVLISLPISLLLSVIPGPIKVRSSAAFTFFGGFAGWIASGWIS